MCASRWLWRALLRIGVIITTHKDPRAYSVMSTVHSHRNIGQQSYRIKAVLNHVFNDAIASGYHCRNDKFSHAEQKALIERLKWSKRFRRGRLRRRPLASQLDPSCSASICALLDIQDERRPIGHSHIWIRSVSACSRLRTVDHRVDQPSIGGFFAFILNRNQNVSLSVVARSNYDTVKENVCSSRPQCDDLRLTEGSTGYQDPEREPW